jgi:phage repressor protein C with HTH and peptisase S24 domain
MPTGIVYIPAAFVPHDRMKAFPVRGECMAGDHIHDGDIVLVDPEEPVASKTTWILVYMPCSYRLIAAPSSCHRYR